MVSVADIHVIIVAAGSGTRFGGDIPKQFIPLGGRPVLMHSVDAFRKALEHRVQITLVLGKDHHELWNDLCRRHGFESPAVVYGGATRLDSVRNALRIHPAGEKLILVHDGARPLVTEALIQRTVEYAERLGAAVPAVPVTDSLLRENARGATETVPRQGLYAVQTPQAFSAGILRMAYANPTENTLTDDASVVRAAGIPVFICPGDSRNIKITNPYDIAVAETLLKSL